MAITEKELVEIESLLGEQATLALEFRQRFPGLTLTRCAASDIEQEVPYRRFAQFDLHLVDRSEHCWRITVDPRRATGIVLASRGSGK